MSDPELDGLSDSPSYVINIKWGLEGLVMPAVGVIGVLGKSETYMINFLISYFLSSL